MEESKLRELIEKNRFKYLEFEDDEREYYYARIDGHNIIWYEKVNPRSRKVEVYFPMEVPATFNNTQWCYLMHNYGRRGMVYNWIGLARKCF